MRIMLIVSDLVVLELGLEFKKRLSLYNLDNAIHDASDLVVLELGLEFKKRLSLKSSLSN
tara:strand:- start:2997 stop:3176 length:180 start_codon:yes stop_codon:yes gene_type:complete